ncbi:hypothetical protein ACWEQU_04900 [Streptomyces nodosus]
MPENSSPSSLSRWLVFAVVLIADVMDLLSTTVTNVATPTILRNLHAPAWIAPWLGAAYALALGSISCSVPASAIVSARAACS